MSIMQITNSPKDPAEYAEEFAGVRAHVVERALRLGRDMLPEILGATLYPPELCASAVTIGREMKLPTPIAFTLMAQFQASSVRKGYGKLGLALSKQKREIVHYLDQVAAYCGNELRAIAVRTNDVEQFATRLYQRYTATN